MIKKEILLYFLLIFINIIINSKEYKTVFNNEFNGKTDIVTFNKIEQKKYNLEKQSLYYDNNNLLKKVENVFSENYSNEKKVIKQIDYYNDKKILYKYEIYFIPAYVFQRNIDKIIEYVDENDNLLKIEYYKEDKISYIESIEKYKELKEYQFLSLNFCDQYLSKAYKENINETNVFLFVDNWYLKGKSVVSIIGDSMDLEKNDNFFINEVWNKMIPALKYESSYKKILVSENNNKFWIIVNENDFKNMKKNIKCLIVYYFGGYNNIPIFMIKKIDYQ